MNFGPMASLSVLGLLLTGCATGMPGSAKRICSDAGIQLKTPEFSHCWKRVRDQQFAREWQMIQAPLTAAAVLGVTAAAAKNVGEANALARARANEAMIPMPAAPQSSPYSRGAPSRSPAPALGGNGTARLCPNGAYVVGNCTLAPNGTYVGGTPNLAPDGTYVSGRPQLAPNGTYVGGEGPLKLCPDGSYIAGNVCRLMPNGQYVGQK
jgi:hypothetical protein